MARIAPIKTPAQAATNYGTNGGSAAAASLWATDLTVDLPAVFSAAQAAIPFWQQQVSTQQAAINMQNGLNRAKNNTTAIIAKINGVGKNSFSAGVRAASAGNYLTFANAWLPAVSNEVALLDRTNPRGDRAANRARQAAYDAWVDSQAGKFRVK